MYSSAENRRWCPHSGQTLSARSNLSRISTCPHASHFSHASGGISRRSRTDWRGFLSFLNHAMTAIGGSGREWLSVDERWLSPKQTIWAQHRTYARPFSVSHYYTST